MKYLLKLSLAAAFAAAPISAHAVTAGGWGAYTNAGSASNCPSFCTSAGGGDFVNSPDGGAGETSAASTDSTYAFGNASAEIESATALPVLKAEASAAEGKQGTGYAFGSQGYTYTGASAVDVNFSYDLTGTVTDGASGYTFNRIQSNIAVISGSEIPFNTHFATLIFEELSSGGGGATVLDTDRLTIDDPAVTSQSGSIEFSLNPGDDFFIVMTLSAIAQNGTADAFSTLVGNFLNAATGTPLVSGAGSPFIVASAPPVVTPGPTPVPLPAAAWMLLAAMGGLASAARRSKA